jgi:hypothetical protein
MLRSEVLEEVLDVKENETFEVKIVFRPDAFDYSVIALKFLNEYKLNHLTTGLCLLLSMTSNLNLGLEHYNYFIPASCQQELIS